MGFFNLTSIATIYIISISILYLYLSISILYLYLFISHDLFKHLFKPGFFTSHLSSPSIWQRADVGHQLHRLYRLPEPRVRELVEGVDVETDGALKDCGILAGKDLAEVFWGKFCEPQ